MLGLFFPLFWQNVGRMPVCFTCYFRMIIEERSIFILLRCSFQQFSYSRFVFSIFFEIFSRFWDISIIVRFTLLVFSHLFIYRYKESRRKYFIRIWQEPKSKTNRIWYTKCLRFCRHDFCNMPTFFCREYFALTILDYLRNNSETLYN